MDAEKISSESLAETERLCNDAVRDAVEVTVKTFEAGDPELHKVQANALYNKDQLFDGE